MRKIKSLSCTFPKTMDSKYLVYLMLLIPSLVLAGSWNNLNCPAPRAPDNGLSFIFRNGEMVHFRCHPGYLMQGKPVAYCVNNLWTEPAPECVPIKKWPVELNVENDMYHYNKPDPSSNEQQRQLFSWGETDDRKNSNSRQSVYGDGPRRLPLINGIWPPQDQKENILAMGPQSTPGPKILVEEEIDIAELRNKQLEELKQQRYTETKGGKRRRGNKKNKRRKNKDIPDVDETVPREMVMSLGNTEEGQALSVSLARPENKTEKPHHKRRHRGHHHKNKHHSRKYKVVHPTASSFIISRPSRVDTSGISPHHTKYQFGSHYNSLEELRVRPVEQVRGNRNASSVDKYDSSCVEPLYGRDVPMMAPLVPNAFVFRYETKKNKAYPFNSYMVVKYRCFSGYVFANAKAQALHCKETSWVGEVPRCVHASGLN